MEEDTTNEEERQGVGAGICVREGKVTINEIDKAQKEREGNSGALWGAKDEMLEEKRMRREEWCNGKGKGGTVHL